MDKMTKSLQSKCREQIENPTDFNSRNERLTKTLSKGGEKLALLKHSALSQLKGGNECDRL
jgi:hypothetical protein